MYNPVYDPYTWYVDDEGNVRVADSDELVACFENYEDADHYINKCIKHGLDF